MKNAVQKFGKFLSGMVMPNIGAFIAWGFLTALFIDTGWIPNAQLNTIVSPMLTYILPALIAYQGGKMVGGDRGAVMAVIATIGVICGTEYTMFMGAMVMGPLAGLVIKKFDQAVDGKIPAGFEMLVNNFSVGILGMIMAIVGFYVIGPVMGVVLNVLNGGVQILVNHGVLPLISVFVEPAKVLFLNNAINHGIFTPLGAEQVQTLGKSVFYMIETNPGPGVGVLLAYMFFAKDKVTKNSAPGALIIHLFGGIHEISFPYILMNPILLLATIGGSVSAMIFNTIFGLGLSGPASPGSIIAFLSMAPKGETLLALISVLIASGVSFLIASPIVKMSNGKNEASLEDATAQMQSMKAQAKGGDVDISKVKKIIFACDAGMGSSAMGATRFRNRIKPLNLGIEVKNTSVDNVPADTDIVVCQVILQDRAKKSAPNAKLVTIDNFLQDPNLDGLYAQLEERSNGAQAPVAAVEEEPEVVALDTGKILVEEGIKTGLKSVSKQEAIKAAGKLLNELGYVNESYIDAMQKREETVTTYMGMGVAIPHGTGDAKNEVLKTGIVLLQYPDGVDFDGEKAQLIFGIAGVGDEHLELLGKISGVIDDEGKLNKLKTTDNVDEIIEIIRQ